MSKDIDHIAREILKQNKEISDIDSHLSKDITAMSKDIIALKKTVKDIDIRLQRMDESIETVLEILREFTIMIDDEQSDKDSWSNEDEPTSWSPYDIADDEEEDSDIEDYSSSLEPDEDVENDL